MEVVLVRHARPHDVASDPAGADPSLTDEGVQQAERLASLFATGRLGQVDVVVSSTMKRARETAAPLAAALGLSVALDERLVELDHGLPAYGFDFTAAFPSRAEAWRAVNEGQWGEHRFDPAGFTRRVTEGIEEHVVRQADGVLVIVCHGGVISAYLSALLGVPGPLFFTPGYTSLTRILALPDGYRELISVNETLHLLI